MRRYRGRSAEITDEVADQVVNMAAALLLAKRKSAARLDAYYNDPVRFLYTFIDWPEGMGLTPYQEEILAMLPSQKRVAAYGPHGLGKTTMEALTLIWFAATRDHASVDWKNPTLASVWRQLTKFLWPEVHKWAKRLKWSEMGIDPWDRRTELLSLSLKLNHGESFAIASDEPTALEGAHADSLLYTFDESKAIPSPSWDSVEGAFSTAGDDTAGEALALACSTPGEESGRFYEICSRKPGFEDWTVRHVTVEEAIAAGRISSAWVEARRRQWGEDSAVFKNRVLGEFASSDSNGVIPLSWVEAAMERWDGPYEDITPDTLGVDVGGGGDGADLTTFAFRSGNVLQEIRRFGRGDTMETAGRIKGVFSATNARPIVDSIGIGAGVVSRLREMDVPVLAFNAAEHSDGRDHSGELSFANKRAHAWWNLRELLDPSGPHKIALPNDDLLIGDLTSPRWRVLSGGRILIESKDDIRKRLGRSTDTGDAVVMAFSVNALSLGNYDEERTANRPFFYDDYVKGGSPLAGILDREF